MKIKLSRIDERVHSQRGLDGAGCYGSECKDECCERGCDVDAGTIKLITRYKDLIEPLVGRNIEDCFSTPLTKDIDFIGKAYRSTAVRKEDKTCAFRLRNGRGCSLFYLWATKKLSKRIVPTICRIFPLTWHRGALFVDTPIRKSCPCKTRPSKGETTASLFETQWKELRALFEFTDKARVQIEKARKGKTAKTTRRS